jgi:trehalose 6-phosphate phosphatase
MPRRDPPRPRPPAPADDWALFLDVDGCLLDLADAPDAVTVPPRLRATLQALSQRLDGALALVSGRSVAVVDALFAPLQLPAAGLHGLELRSATLQQAPPPPSPALAVILEEALAMARAWPGVVVEDKGAALGLHWRAAPKAMDALRGFAEAVLPRLPGYRLQPGNQVVELRPAAGDKGAAISALLGQPPFQGRTAVFAGDDITDEAGFAVVNAHAGVSVLVGNREPSAAHFALRDPAAVRRWLGSGATR